MEASAYNHTLAAPPALVGSSPLLRLRSDEQLIALVRQGHNHAFDALVQRYQPRLLAFCRHMLSSTEDAEDVLQEVFTAAFNAMRADDRPINARPWLYRISRNRCLNHLRRPQPTGLDSMDIFERDGGTSAADTAHRRDEFRQIVSDVQELPETQRTALLLREIDALSYEQISQAMDTTVPSVKSLLVRARVSLAEAAEARLLTCEEVREELGRVAEGLQRSTSPMRRHVRGCERCRIFKRELQTANRALAAVYPLGPLVLFKKFFLVKLAFGGSAGGQAAASGTTAAGGGAIAAGGAGGLISAGLSTFASKTAAGLAAAAIVTAGAVEVEHVTRDPGPDRAPIAQQVLEPTPLPETVASTATPVPVAAPVARADERASADVKAVAEPAEPASSEDTPASAGDPSSSETPAAPAETPAPPVAAPVAGTEPAAPSGPQGTDEQQSSTTIPAGEAPAVTEPDPVAVAPEGSPQPTAPPPTPPPSSSSGSGPQQTAG